MNARLPAAMLCCALLLAGCGGHKNKADQRTASGQVLQGTISDEMLPLATVTSQPPHARPRAAATGDEADQDLTQDSGDADATPGDAPLIAAPTDEGD